MAAIPHLREPRGDPVSGVGRQVGGPGPWGDLMSDSCCLVWQEDGPVAAEALHAAHPAAAADHPCATVPELAPGTVSLHQGHGHSQEPVPGHGQWLRE